MRERLASSRALGTSSECAVSAMNLPFTDPHVTAVTRQLQIPQPLQSNFSTSLRFTPVLPDHPHVNQNHEQAFGPIYCSRIILLRFERPAMCDSFTSERVAVRLCVDRAQGPAARSCNRCLDPVGSIQWECVFGAVSSHHDGRETQINHHDGRAIQIAHLLFTCNHVSVLHQL